MNRQGPTHRKTRRAWILSGLGGLLVGCAAPAGVTNTPVVVQTAGPTDDNSAALSSYYQTVFAGMRDALRGGNRDSLAELRYMILQHKRDGMADFAHQQIEQFELLGDGLEFELDLPNHCSLVCKTSGATAHQKQVFELRLEGYRDGRVLELGGTGANAVAFRVLVKLRDFDSSGQFAESAQNLTLRVGQTHRLVDGQALTMPFEIHGAGAHVAVRELAMRVEFLPGVVTVDGRRLPVCQFSRRRASRGQIDQLTAREKLTRRPGTTSCCEANVMIYPEGYEAVQKAPLQTLLIAIRRGQSKWFRHVFLATHFMPAADREKAMARLIQWVRNGTGPQRLVAMGCLRVLSREDLSVADREVWLRWWQSRTKQPK